MTIANRLTALTDKTGAAAQRSGRNPASITLVAVSKTQPQSAVLEAYTAGQRVFGENRVQEAVAKFTDMRTTHQDLQLWLIGPLQTNKVTAAVRMFDTIATLDRPKLAEALAQEMSKQQRWPDILIEVNSGNEPQKAGISPAALPDFYADCRNRLHLPIKGLMCIPPIATDPAPYFRDLTKLANQLQLPIRSMGMSGDFETAIACGSTAIRVGTALFGERPTKG